MKKALMIMILASVGSVSFAGSTNSASSPSLVGTKNVDCPYRKQSNNNDMFKDTAVKADKSSLNKPTDARN